MVTEMNYVIGKLCTNIAEQAGVYSKGSVEHYLFMGGKESQVKQTIFLIYLGWSSSFDSSPQSQL